MKPYIIFLAALLFFSLNLSGQETKKMYLEIAAGINYSDVNGDEFSGSFLPKEDYLLYHSSGDGDNGYFLGLGTSFRISNRLLASIKANYTELRYEISSEVSNLNPTAMRPLSSEIPVSFDGVAKHRFIDFQAGLQYSFSQNIEKGLLVSATVSNMVYLNTRRDIDVVYEDLSEATLKNDSSSTEPAYNNLWLAGLELAYHIPLNKNLIIAPVVGSKFSLNSFFDKNSAGPIFYAGVSLKWAY